MALIACPECGRQVSSSAVACPECAYPVASGTPPVGVPAVRRSKWRGRLLLAANVGARVLFGSILIGFGLEGTDDAAGAAVVGGLAIAASAIPVIVRAWYSRGTALAGAPRTESLEAMAQRQREQMAAFAQAQADRIADLEERIDFAERLLTKRREQLNP